METQGTLRSVYVFYIEYMMTPLPELTMHVINSLSWASEPSGTSDVLELHVVISNVPANRQFKVSDSVFEININMPTDTACLTECQHVLEVV